MWDPVSWELDYGNLLVDRRPVLGPRKIFKNKASGEEIDESEYLTSQCATG